MHKSVMIPVQIKKVKDPKGKEELMATVPMNILFGNEFNAKWLEENLKKVEISYFSLVKKMKNIYEKIHSSRNKNKRLLLYWKFGDEIIKFLEKNKEDSIFLEKFIRSFSKDVGISKNMIMRCKKFRLLYPEVQKIDLNRSFDSYVATFEKGYLPENRKRGKKVSKVFKKRKPSIREKTLYVKYPHDEKVNSLEKKNQKIYFKTDDVIIYNDNFFTIDSIEENSVDLIVTSPPYNVDIGYNTFDDKISYKQYLEFTQNWLRQAYKFLKTDGRFCLNIPLDKNKGGQQSVGADLTTIAKQVGFQYHSTIIWNEGNISRRTAWGSWLSASAPYVIAPVELIVILYKKRWKKTSGSRKSDISKKEFMEWTNGVWTFSGESKKKIGHPAPFPVELPKRCIKLFTFVGDTVLDPFLGSGSTLISCTLTERKGIGVEIDKNYCEIAKQRLIKEANILQPSLKLAEKSKKWKRKNQ